MSSVYDFDAARCDCSGDGRGHFPNCNAWPRVSRSYPTLLGEDWNAIFSRDALSFTLFELETIRDFADLLAKGKSQ